MSRRRLIPLGIAVVGLLALAAFVAHGRPLSTGGGGGAGPSRTFWDYAFTTIFIFALLSLAVGLWATWALRPDVGKRQSYPARTARALVRLAIILAIGFLIRHYFLLHHGLHFPSTKPEKLPNGKTGSASNGSRAGNETQIKPGEVIVVLVLLIAWGIVAYFRRKRLGQPILRRRGSAPETLAAALDESLDDLRDDPDLRRAIIAAYARMEHALAAAGLPRDPAETPLEYLERTLLSLDASSAAVRRLTDLFEWARFSHHEPEPSMRDEAVDALVTVRDELRVAQPVFA